MLGGLLLELGLALLESAQFREGLAVLVPVGMFLAGHDVVERGETDHDTVDSTRYRTREQLLVGPTTASYGEVTEHVDRPRIRHPRRTPEATKRRYINGDRQLAGRLVGHAADSKPSTQLAQRCREAAEVVIGAARHHVDVDGLAMRAMGLGTEAANNHALHGVGVEDSDDPFGVETSGSFSWHAVPQLGAER